MDTKEKLLLAALKVFSRLGYEGASVNDIAMELGLSKTAMYKYFKSKREVFDSILRRMEERDYENATQFSMPPELFSEMPEKYKNTDIESICADTTAMYFYWTEDEFASAFRRMLCIERFHSEDMEKLFQQYLGIGPIRYLEDVFRQYTAEPEKTAFRFYAPMLALIEIYDGAEDKDELKQRLSEHLSDFIRELDRETEAQEAPIAYPLSEKYASDEFMSMIMGPNPLKLAEELLTDSLIPKDAIVCDLGSGTGLTSVFMAKEYGYRVCAADLWSDPEENQKFFRSLGLTSEQIFPVKADAAALPFDKETFDAVVSVDSYNYFGRDRDYLGEKLLPFVKKGGYIYVAVPGMKKDCHDALPPELLLSWTPEQMEYMHDTAYWRSMIEDTEGIEILDVSEMRSNKEVWDDWLRQENPYSVGDRKSMEAGAGKYLNFIKLVVRKL